MPHTSPKFPRWKHAYDLADQLISLAPWRWLWDRDLIGIVDPASIDPLESPMVASVMGRDGVHRAVAVYESVYDYLAIQNLSDEDAAEELLNIPQVQLSIESHDQLFPEEHERIRRFKKKYRPTIGYPHFHQFRPGYAPWHIDADGLERLIVGLETVLAAAKQLRKDAQLLEQLRADLDRDKTLTVFSPAAKRNQAPTISSIPFPDRPEPIQQFPNIADLTELKNLQCQPVALEIDLRVVPMFVDCPDGGPPASSMVILAVDCETGQVSALDLIPCLDQDAARTAFPELVRQLFVKLNFLPKTIYVRNQRFYDSLMGTASALGIKDLHVSQLNLVRDCLDSLLDHMGNNDADSIAGDLFDDVGLLDGDESMLPAAPAIEFVPGATPERLQRFLSHPFDDHPGCFTWNRSLTAGDLAQVPLVRRIWYMLTIIAAAPKGLKATAAGKLPRAVVQELDEIFYKGHPVNFAKPMKESDSPEILRLRAFLLHTDWMELRNNRFFITEKARLAMLDNFAGQHFLDLMHDFCRQITWYKWDNLGDVQYAQDLFLVILVSMRGDVKFTPVETIIERFESLYPSEIDSDDDACFELIEYRFIRRFALEFGLIEIEDLKHPLDSRFEYVDYRITPLYKKLLQFNA